MFIEFNIRTKSLKCEISKKYQLKSMKQRLNKNEALKIPEFPSLMQNLWSQNTFIYLKYLFGKLKLLIAFFFVFFLNDAYA